MEKELIREKILAMGTDVCGFASIDRFADAPEGFRPTDIYPACRSVIVLGIAMPKGLYDVKPDYIYSHFNDKSTVWVDELTFRAAKWIEQGSSADAIPLPCDGPYEAWDPQTLHAHGLLSMKHAAVNAGLGTLGKNTLLLNARFGNRLTVGALLTSLELAPDPLAQSVCLPGCKLCLTSCPVHALDGSTADQHACRPNTYATTPRGFDVVKCNKCRTVCPMRLGK